MTAARTPAAAGRLAFAIATLLAASATSPTAFADTRLRASGDLGAGFDTNVSNAEADADVRDSSFLTGAGHVELVQPLTLYTTLIARGSVQGEEYNHFDGLSNVRGTALLRLMHRPSGGFHTPSFAIWGSASVWEFESAIRDSAEYRGGVFVSQQVTTRVRGRLGVSVSERESESRVFDLRGASARLDLDWLAAAHTTVYAAYQFHEGDVVSTAAPTFKVINAAEAIEPDDAFGGFAANQFAYRLDARSHIGTLGVNQGLSRHFSVDAQIQAIGTDAEGGNQYQRWLGIVSVLMSL